MLRSYVLICSAVVLRLISGGAELIGVTNEDDAYVVAAWASWLLPLAGLELTQRLTVSSAPSEPRRYDSSSAHGSDG